MGADKKDLKALLAEYGRRDQQEQEKEEEEKDLAILPAKTGSAVGMKLESNTRSAEDQGKDCAMILHVYEQKEMECQSAAVKSTSLSSACVGAVTCDSVKRANSLGGGGGGGAKERSRSLISCTPPPSCSPSLGPIRCNNEDHPFSTPSLTYSTLPTIISPSSEEDEESALTKPC